MLGKVGSTSPPIGINIVLTIDDKGLQPVDRIYEGTINPPTPNLTLAFNIQWYKSESQQDGNSRVFNVYGGEGLDISDDGSRWFVNLDNLPEWADHMHPNSFTNNGMYELTISEFSGGKNAVFRKYFVIEGEH